MVEQKSSILERLKVCWNVLTKKNYVYFGVGKEPIVWNEDGSYKSTNPDALRCYSCVTYDYKFDSNKGIQNLHDFVWGCIEKFAKQAQEGKY